MLRTMFSRGCCARDELWCSTATSAVAAVVLLLLISGFRHTVDAVPVVENVDQGSRSDAGNLSQASQQGSVLFRASKPNLIFIMADDLGWNDVGWNPYTSVKTPTLAKLAAKGVIFSNYYSLPKCAPSRHAFMTGRHPMHTGFQATNARPDLPIGAPLDTPLISNALKGLGYSTHLVGKWHLGFCNWSYTPTERGFDSFFGFYGGSTDHYLHSKRWNNMFGYDLRSDKNDAHKKFQNRFSSHIFTKQAQKIIRTHDQSKPLFLLAMLSAPHAPIQVPWAYRRRYSEEMRRGWTSKEAAYAAMVTAIDTSVGKIVSTLRKAKMLDNSIVIFTSDNGGFAPSSNFPLRGTKSTQFEGGTRVPAMIFSPLLQRRGYVNTNLFHVTDWLPTLVSIAGGKRSDIPHTVDGVDASLSVLTGAPSPRQRIVYNVDKTNRQFRAAIRDGTWKLIQGNWQKIRSGWANELDILRKAQHDIPLHSLFNPAGAPWNTSFAFSLLANNAGMADLSGPFWVGKTSYFLFNLKDDPAEKINVLHYRGEHDGIFLRLLAELRTHIKSAHDDVVRQAQPSPQANPSLYGDVWSPGWC